MEDVLVRGVAADKKQAKVTVVGVDDKPGEAARLFRDVAEAGINVDVIVQNVSHDGRANISFTIPEEDIARVQKLFEDHNVVKNTEVAYDDQIAKISIVGVGMRSHTGVASKMFSVLAEAGVNIIMISTSEIRVSVVIPKDRADEAVQALHAGFGLDADTKVEP